MVCVNPTDDGGDGGASGSCGGGGGGCGGGGFFLGPRQHHQQHGGPVGVALPGAAGSLTTAGSAAATVPEDPNKKIWKPYTITKSRENWTEQEHDKFLEALQLFNRDWKKIEAFVGSKTVIQIRSHAQKYFLKVQKNGTSEHVPPPRPKRKAAHPYPQKASKNAPLLSQTTVPFQTSSCILEPGYALGTETSSILGNSSASATVSSWASISVQPNASHITKVMPDFAQVYSFIGSVFDPSTGGHLQKLKEMDPIDVETVLLLMKNLSINLSRPDFEDHRRLLLSYDVGIKELKPGSMNSMLQADKPMSAPSMVKGN